MRLMSPHDQLGEFGQSVFVQHNQMLSFDGIRLVDFLYSHKTTVLFMCISRSTNVTSSSAEMEKCKKMKSV